MCKENCTCKKYNVYRIDNEVCYTGYSLVAAENAEEATKYVKEFKERDKDNALNSRGYYDKITEEDVIEYLSSGKPGIVFYGIDYIGLS